MEKNLKIAPPVPFDVARQVRVFQPYIQYVEISLNGCSIERKKVRLPNSVLNIDSQSELSSRINTTFNLIENSSDLASNKREIDDELGLLRDTYAKCLGKPWGRVMLRAKKREFDSKVKKLEKTIAEYQKDFKEKIAHLIGESVYRLVEHYTPYILNSPPQSLLAQIQSEKPTMKQTQKWLFDQLSNIFPKPETLVKKMSLEVHYKDVTYETLNEDGFADALENAFPYVEWDKPFNEFKAVKAKKQLTLEEV